MFKMYLFWLWWVFMAARGLSLVALSGCGFQASHFGGLGSRALVQ